MKRKIFITGGTGFLGSEIIKRLKRESFEITGLVRSEKSKNKLLDLDVNTIFGDINNVDKWERKLLNIDIVIHCAAPVEFWGAWEKYKKGIIDATKDIYIASEKNNVKQFVFISSESVLQDKKDLIDIDEAESYPTEPNSFYGKSKMLAEKFILSQKGKMKSIILRPTFIWGKNVKALDTIIEKIKSKDFMWINKGESLLEMVHVKNVAEAVCLSVTKGENFNKEIYFVTVDNPQTVRSFLTKLINTQKINPPNKNIPKWLALALASIIEGFWKMFNVKSIPMITKFDVAFVAMSRKYNISKIKTDLDYKPVLSEKKGLEEMKIDDI